MLLLLALDLGRLCVGRLARVALERLDDRGVVARRGAPFRISRRPFACRVQLALRDVAALGPDGRLDVRGLGRQQLLVVVLPDGVALALLERLELLEALAPLLELDFGSEPVWNSNFGRPTETRLLDGVKVDEGLSQ